MHGPFRSRRHPWPRNVNRAPPRPDTSLSAEISCPNANSLGSKSGDCAAWRRQLQADALARARQDEANDLVIDPLCGAARRSDRGSRPFPDARARKDRGRPSRLSPRRRASRVCDFRGRSRRDGQLALRIVADELEAVRRRAARERQRGQAPGLRDRGKRP